MLVTLLDNKKRTTTALTFLQQVTNTIEKSNYSLHI